MRPFLSSVNAPPMKATPKTLSVLVSIVLLAGAISTTGQHANPQRAHVVILSTTDMHGRVFPIDYYTNKYDNVGIAKVATLVKEARKNDPDLMLVDSGDTIQGTPLEYFHNKRNNTPPDPMMLAMNALKYDSMTVGNHEYNFGWQVLNKARSEAKFPWLSANTYDVASDKPHTHYQPYPLTEVQRVRIGVLGSTIPVTEKTEIDPEIAKLGEPYDKETQAWLGRAIGDSSEEMTARDCRFHDTAIIDLIQRVQLEAGKADVSMAACFNPSARIPKGQVTVRDIAGLYEYENTLVTLELTGQQLKDALEHSARYFKQYQPGKSLNDLVDNRIPGYNFDVAEGVAYDIDITKPFGERILNLKFKGQPLAMTQKLRVVTNNYRVNGGGGFTMFKNAPVVYRSSEEVRELIIDWVERNKTVPMETDNNWRIIGAQ